MATIRSYTTIEQSKVLAEILPLESADMKWYFWKSEIDAPKLPTFGYGKDAAENCKSSEAVYLPCWSLSSLLSVLPSVIKRKGKRMFLTLEKAGAYNLYYKSTDRLDELWETKEEPVDACVEMIVNLDKLNLL